MITPRFIVAFSGHRSIDNEEALHGALTDQLSKLQEKARDANGELEYYGSIAYGADTIAVEVCRELGIPVHLILPKPVAMKKDAPEEVDKAHGFAADFSKEVDGVATFRQDLWDRSYRQIVDARLGKQGGTLRLVASSHVAPDCYYDAGLRTLDACDILLAVWDGEASKGLGGTADMVDYAEHQSIAVIVLSPDGTPGASCNKALSQFANTADDIGLKTMGDVTNYCDSQGCDNAQSTKQSNEAPVGQLFAQLEACSGSEADEFRDALKKIIYAHAAATLIAAMAAIFPQTILPWKIVLAGLAGLEACFIGWAILRTRKLHKKETHERWMKARFATEIMRGLRDSQGLLDPLHPLVARHAPEWRRFAVSAALDTVRADPPLADWSEARNAYVDTRLCHPDPKIGQIAYLEWKQPPSQAHFEKTQRWGRGLGIAAIVFVLGAFFYKSLLVYLKVTHGYVSPALANTSGSEMFSWVCDFFFKYLPIALPLLAGVFISLRMALDSGRRTYRYKDLAARLKTLAHTLKELKSESSVHRAVVATEEILLDEIIEWHLAEQQNGAH